MAIPRAIGKRIGWALALVLTGIAVWIIGLGVFIASASLRQGYNWDEMDWNDDGSTSISEFLRSSAVGKRTGSENAVACLEYYSMKDGLPIKIVCPTSSS